MSDTHGLSTELDRPPAMRWAVGGLFLEALATRDFDKMSDCFEPARSPG